MQSRLIITASCAIEGIEPRLYLAGDIQIVPLHGAFCYCVGCSAAHEAQSHAVEQGLTPDSVAESLASNESSLMAASRAAGGSIGVYNPPAPPSTIATVHQLLTADAIKAETSGNTPAATTAAFSAKIDFKPASASTYAGYTADTGLTYGTRNGLTYGWKTSNTSSHFDRNSSKSPDQRYDTTALMSSTDVWEIKVPNGWYDVDVYAGDANKGGADLRINVEGQLAVWAQLHYSEKRFGEGHIKVQVKDGKLTVSTGSGAKNNSITHIDIAQGSAPKSYSTINNISWGKSSSVKSPISRVESGVVRVGDKIYFIGGYYKDYNNVTNRVDILDLKTNKWSRGASLPGAQTHAGATTDGRYIYWAGGQYGALYSRKGTNEVWRYDTQQNKWSRYTNLPNVRFGGGLSYVNGTLVFFGGATSDRNTASNKAWKLDTTKSGAKWVAIANMPKAADHLGHGEMDGIIYAFGGEHDHGNSYVQHADVFAYNLKTNTWTRKADMPTASSHFEGNVIEYKGRFYIFAGQVNAQLLTSQVRSYDPKSDKWLLHNSLPEKRKGGGGWVYNNKFYYLTGDAWGSGQPTYALVGTIKTSVTIPGEPSPPPSDDEGGAIRGYVFSDADGDAKYDTGEEKLASRTVYLDQNRNGKLDSSERSTTTDSSGNYLFSDLPIDTYYVTRVFPKGYALSNSATGYITVEVDEDTQIVNIGSKVV